MKKRKNSVFITSFFVLKIYYFEELFSGSKRRLFLAAKSMRK